MATSNFITESSTVIFQRDRTLRHGKVSKQGKIEICNMWIHTQGAIGHLYGTEFTVNGKKQLVPKADGACGTSEPVGDADNRFLQDTTDNQKMERQEIEKMKQDGVDGQTIVERITEGSATFKSKTSYSQEKYLKRKRYRHVPVVTVLRPTVRLVCEMFAQRKQTKNTLPLRVDTLGQMLCYSNVRSGSRLLVAESCAGVVVAALLSRLAGAGELVQLHTGGQPNNPAIDWLGLGEETRRVLKLMPTNRISSLLQTDGSGEGAHQLQDVEMKPAESVEPESNRMEAENPNSTITDEPTQVNADEEDEQPTNLATVVTPAEEDKSTEGQAAPDKETHTNDVKSQNQSGRQLKAGQKRKMELTEEELEEKRKKRQEARDAKERLVKETAEVVRNGDFDGLLIATIHHPLPLLKSLARHLAPSRQIVIYHPYIEVLKECCVQLKQMNVINMRLTETWYRHYQVLPDRTHPEVNMSGTGGYLLVATTVLPPPS